LLINNFRGGQVIPHVFVGIDVSKKELSITMIGDEIYYSPYSGGTA